MTNPSLDQIKARIHALASKTVDNGCTEQEALSAMEAVGRLLTKHNLSMSEIDIRHEKYKEDYVKLKHKNINKNISTLLVYIAEFCDCKCWNAPGHEDFVPHVKYTFFGTKSDTEMASYLLFICTQAMLNDAHKYVKALGVGQGGARGPSNNFQYGFAVRIGARLKEIKAANKIEINTSGSCELMVLKDQLVTEEFAKLNLGLRKAAPRKISRDDYARMAGQNAANNVNLQSPLSGQANKLAIK